MIRIPAEAVLTIARGIYPDISDRVLEALVEFSAIDTQGNTIDEVKTRINEVLSKRVDKFEINELYQILTISDVLRHIERSDTDE